ncbi:hypothetical protein [Nostoc sp. CHAB 5715]|nr:hypothetical protein [Nostoc sp. CHAB 5715]MCC5622899.1 hypothetical protein [Nostoc sp. CHAB 5715]
MTLIQEYDLLGTRVLHLIGTANDKHLSAQCPMPNFLYLRSQTDLT